MKTTLRCVLGAAALGLAAAACSSGSASRAHTTVPLAAATKPAISAAQACKDFDAWWLTTANGTNLRDNQMLSRAVAEAPSGQLYQGISTIQQNVDYVAGQPSGGTQQAEKNLVITQVNNVVTNDCAAVNPNGG